MKKSRLCRGTEFYCDREVRFARWERGLWRRECRRQEKWSNAFAATVFFLLFTSCVLLSLLISS